MLNMPISVFHCLVIDDNLRTNNNCGINSMIKEKSGKIKYNELNKKRKIGTNLRNSSLLQR